MIGEEIDIMVVRENTAGEYSSTGEIVRTEDVELAVQSGLFAQKGIDMQEKRGVELFR